MGHARIRGSRGWVTARGHPAITLRLTPRLIPPPMKLPPRAPTLQDLLDAGRFERIPQLLSSNIGQLPENKYILRQAKLGEGESHVDG